MQPFAFCRRLKQYNIPICILLKSNNCVGKVCNFQTIKVFSMICWILKLYKQTILICLYSVEIKILNYTFSRDKEAAASALRAVSA